MLQSIGIFYLIELVCRCLFLSGLPCWNLHFGWCFKLYSISHGSVFCGAEKDELDLKKREGDKR